MSALLLAAFCARDLEKTARIQYTVVVPARGVWKTRGAMRLSRHTMTLTNGLNRTLLPLLLLLVPYACATNWGCGS